MSRRTSAAALITAVVLVMGCGSVEAQPQSAYKPASGPWRPIPAPEATPAPSEAPSPSYEAPQRTSVRAVITVPRSLTGVATWYDYVPGGAAAGPALRAAIGKGWRESAVRVCAAGRCVKAVLSDWCQCYGTRLVDLDRRGFAALADPSLGVLSVEVTW